LDEYDAMIMANIVRRLVQTLSRRNLNRAKTLEELKSAHDALKKTYEEKLDEMKALEKSHKGIKEATKEVWVQTDREETHEEEKLKKKKKDR